MTDGFAVELELPLINSRVVQYKMGLQKRLGTFRGGRSVHGVQYLGLHDREERGWTSTLLWLLGNRFGERWSTMTMLGVGDVTLREGNETGTIVNHSTFYDLNPDTVLGLELNRQNGQGAYWLLMPQVHRSFGKLGCRAASVPKSPHRAVPAAFGLAPDPRAVMETRRQERGANGRYSMTIALICLDADDTLWHNMRHFAATEEALVGLLAPLPRRGSPAPRWRRARRATCGSMATAPRALPCR